MSDKNRKKLLLMGRSGSGKSSMRSIIFSNYSAFDTRRLGATIDVEHSHLRFLGNMTLNLWDCGGQDVFMENYFQQQKDHIFQMVEVLIHVFDVESTEVLKDIEIFTRALTQLKKYSPNAKIFVLLHKMDLVQLDKRQELFQLMMNKLNETSKCYGFPEIHGFPTSIWDESLYKAWSQIVCSMIPNMNEYQMYCKKIGDIMNCKEMILFEKTTFLVVCSSLNNDSAAATYQKFPQGLDPKRFEKISNVMKNFKQSSIKMKSSNFQNLMIRHSGIYVCELTNNLMCFLVLNRNVGNNGVEAAAEQQQQEALVLENIRKIQKYFV
ncbi:GTP-binding protein gtr1 [Hanseniaspora osmophila]|uniref:GTP-binding protein n=1 Tax=Hanseniaspora osmophila TaxID=56408 RepID=A0A1E5RE40_9ASCO|nr:GTP-binding protein GTR1 [Hanseniaspora osmophila]